MYLMSLFQVIMNIATLSASIPSVFGNSTARFIINVSEYCHRSSAANSYSSRSNFRYSEPGINVLMCPFFNSSLAFHRSYWETPETIMQMMRPVEPSIHSSRTGRPH